MDEFMANGWMNHSEWMRDGWMDGWLDGWRAGCARWPGACAFGWMDGCMANGWMDECLANGWMNHSGWLAGFLISKI